MSRRPFIFAALAVTALLALAASAAYTRPLSAAGRRSGTLPRSLVDYTFTTIIIVSIVLFILVLPLVSFRRRGGEHPHPARTLRTIAILLVAVSLISLIRFDPRLRHFFHLNTPAQHVHLGKGGKGGKGVHHSPSPPAVGFQWDELIVVLILVSLIVGLVIALRRRRPDDGSGGAGETLAEAISESLDDLRTDPDLRRAIVAAYARMERALAASGVRRNPAEGPHEYLERALLAVDASADSARRLTELFERAKFSHHEPDERMRGEAIDALEAIRDELWAGSAVAA